MDLVPMKDREEPMYSLLHISDQGKMSVLLYYTEFAYRKVLSEVLRRVKHPEDPDKLTIETLAQTAEKICIDKGLEYFFPDKVEVHGTRMHCSHTPCAYNKEGGCYSPALGITNDDNDDPVCGSVQYEESTDG